MIKRCKIIFGTFVEIKIFNTDSFVNSFICETIEKAFEELQEIHNLMSFFDEKSQLSLLNKEAHKQEIMVDPRLFEVLTTAQNLHKISDGIFDITLHRSLQNSSASNIELKENFSVKFKQELQIDLGGIAKGYGVDRAAKILEKQGINNYIINAGGDLRVGKLAQEISIRDPKNPNLSIYETKLFSQSMATSAGYFSFQKISGKKTYPIFQPFIGALEYKNETISIITRSCMIADALTKIVAIKKSEAQEILTKFNAKALIL